jgi:hypothetical protein
MPKWGKGGEEFEVEGSHLPKVIHFPDGEVGSDYDESWDSPKWKDLEQLLLDEDITGDFDILFVGLMDSPEREISAFPAVVNAEDVFTALDRNPNASTEQLAYELSGMLNMPYHITGIVVRKRLYTRQGGRIGR